MRNEQPTFSGQPIVEKGHKPEENHVSRTSGSWSSVYDRPFALFLASTSASSNDLATIQFLLSDVCRQTWSGSGDFK
jgi:hypothetical protein